MGGGGVALVGRGKARLIFERVCAAQNILRPLARIDCNDCSVITVLEPTVCSPIALSCPNAPSCNLDFRTLYRPDPHFCTGASILIPDRHTHDRQS